MIILWAGCAGFAGANVVSRWFGQSDGAAISIVSSENFGQLEGDGKCFFIREGTSGLESSGCYLLNINLEQPRVCWRGVCLLVMSFAVYLD